MLVRLPMLVSNSWWKGYRRDNNMLNAGAIVGVDFNQPNSTYFQIKCAGKIYAIRYDAVYLDVDLDHASNNAILFCFPIVAPPNPANEEGVTAPQKNCTKISVWRESDNMIRRTTTITLPHPNTTNLPANKSTKRQKQQSTLIYFWVQSLELMHWMMRKKES